MQRRCQRVCGPVRASEEVLQQLHRAKDQKPIQTNVAKVDRTRGWLNGQFNTYAICGAIHRTGELEDSLLHLAKADGIVSKSF